MNVLHSLLWILWLRLSIVFAVDLLLFPKRYGLKEENCPDNSQAQRGRDGNVLWCSRDEECKYSYRCTAIPGLKHFGTQIKYCCPTKTSVCLLPPQPGYGDCGIAPKTMYYFDQTALQCQEIQVLECQGLNDNRFPSVEACRRRCETTACEPGESPLFEKGHEGGPRLCQKSDRCPAGYTCRFDELFRRHVCCGYKSQGTCAVGQKPFMLPFMGRAQQCREDHLKDTCPPDFVCTANLATGQRHCCSLERGVCPAGQSPYIHPLTDKTTKCNPVAYAGGDCPKGYFCAATVTGAQWGFCCSEAVTASCPSDTAPFLDHGTRQPQKCTIGVSVCTIGYSCQNADPLAIVGFCCSERPTGPSALKPGRAGTSTLYSLAPVQHRPLLPLAPVVVRPEEAVLIEQFRPEIRLVDLQREVDRSEERFLRKQAEVAAKKRQLPHRRRPATVRSNRPKCPPPMTPLLYMGTSLPLSCRQNSVSQCPEPAQCVSAFLDPLGRSLCCLQADGEDIDELLGVESEPMPAGVMPGAPEKAVAGPTPQVTVVDRPTPVFVRVQSSTDPFCPTVVEKRTCLPGSTDVCVEEGFFCQFNIQFQQFRCCSLSRALVADAVVATAPATAIVVQS